MSLLLNLLACVAIACLVASGIYGLAVLSGRHDRPSPLELEMAFEKAVLAIPFQKGGDDRRWLAWQWSLAQLPPGEIVPSPPMPTGKPEPKTLDEVNAWRRAEQARIDRDRIAREVDLTRQILRAEKVERTPELEGQPYKTGETVTILSFDGTRTNITIPHGSARRLWRQAKMPGEFPEDGDINERRARLRDYR